MKVAVGSENPVKVAAVRSVFERVWPEAGITAVSVPSGVSEMPMSDAESITGARNRARAARRALGADFGVGLEGGVSEEEAGLMVHGWVVIVDGNGREGIGGGARLMLPDSIADRIRAGEELGPVMDEVMGETELRRKGGAVSALTAGLVVRREAFAAAVAYALSPFLVPRLYETPSSAS